MEHPATHHTNSAGPVKSRKSIGAGRVRTEFEETVSISIYLLAINIHDMGKVIDSRNLQKAHDLSTTITRFNSMK